MHILWNFPAFKADGIHIHLFSIFINLRHSFSAYYRFVFTFASCIIIFSQSDAQTYFVHQQQWPSHSLVKLTLDCYCPNCCEIEDIGPTRNWGATITMSPEGRLYGIDESTEDLYLIDTLTGSSTLYFDLPDNFNHFLGLVSVGGGIFYSFLVTNFNEADTLVEINVPAGTVTKLGRLNYRAAGDLTVSEGEIYYMSNQDAFEYHGRVVKLNISNPDQCTFMTPLYPLYINYGLSATDMCNTLIGTELLQEDELILINLKEIIYQTTLCQIDGLISLTSMQEYDVPAICNEVDLDCNNSSMAFDNDFNTDEINCHKPLVPISDNDIIIFNDTVITEMRVHLVGFVPDGPNETLELIGGTAIGVDVTGTGTDLITMTNNGLGSAGDYIFLLQRIFYQNVADYPTGGIRTIEVQFTTGSGMMSQVSTSFVEVVELPIFPVDLGPDLVLCEGETATFDAGNPGAQYVWSNGQFSQMIHTDDVGIYIVTVNGAAACPNQDTVKLDFKPVINVSLEGDDKICGDEQANLEIITDTPFSLDISITTSFDSAFVIQDVNDTYEIAVTPNVSTTYTITDISFPLQGCIVMDDSTQTIDVFPSYELIFYETICEGDSILIGFDYQKVAGIYDNSFYTEEGCDSAVTTILSITPLLRIFKQSTSCDSASLGVFVSYLPGLNVCDTLLETTVTFQASDTINVSQGTCRLNEVGNVVTTALINQYGCDSIILTTLFYNPPSDTIQVYGTSCHANDLGTFQNLFTDQTGCDSLVITTISLASTDTLYLSEVSCDASSWGIFQYTFTGSDGCDSLIINTINPDVPDTTYLFSTSCDSASLGVWQNILTGINGCDSLIISTVAYSSIDSIVINRSSCNPADVGIFIQHLINRFGCDSVVTETVTLSPSNATILSSTTCDPAGVGVFINSLINQYGCDSVVTETVTLLPSNETLLFANTCRSSEAGIFSTTYSNQFGCDSIVILSVSLLPTDTTLLSFTTCDSLEAGTTESLFTGQDGCDSLVIKKTALLPLPIVSIDTDNSFNGYDISCFGQSDGSASTIVQGIAPFTYLWSTGSSDQSISGLAAGSYDVMVTDGNGCGTQSVFQIIQPQLFEITFLISQPDCFTIQEGNITAQTTGGVSPYRFSIDGIHYQTTSDFTGLGEGAYQISALDANDCFSTEIIWINVPLQVDVSLGEDVIIYNKDSVQLEAIINIPFDSLASVVWTGIDSMDCPECLTQHVVPIVTTTYEVVVVSADGCSDRDSKTIYSNLENDVYVPNVFSPNGDGINDLLYISAEPFVQEVESFMIFDRWGNVIFLNERFLPNDPSEAWDGKKKGVTMNPGVFAYKLIVRFSDGRMEMRYGDVTLMR